MQLGPQLLRSISRRKISPPGSSARTREYVIVRLCYHGELGASAGACLAPKVQRLSEGGLEPSPQGEPSSRLRHRLRRLATTRGGSRHHGTADLESSASDSRPRNIARNKERIFFYKLTSPLPANVMSKTPAQLGQMLVRFACKINGPSNKYSWVALINPFAAAFKAMATRAPNVLSNLRHLSYMLDLADYSFEKNWFIGLSVRRFYPRFPTIRVEPSRRSSQEPGPGSPPHSVQ